MHKAIFLDRDGVLNREVDVLRNVRQLRVLPGVASALKKIKKLGFLAVIITNQPVIARGWLTEKGVENINQTLIDRLAKKGGVIDAVYYCPHHPNANLKKYRVKCACRKPGIGMIKNAARDLRIDLKKSWMVGDTTMDVMTGKNARMRTILVKTGYAGKDRRYNVRADFVVKNLNGAASILKKYGK